MVENKTVILYVWNQLFNKFSKICYFGSGDKLASEVVENTDDISRNTFH